MRYWIDILVVGFRDSSVLWSALLPFAGEHSTHAEKQNGSIHVMSVDILYCVNICFVYVPGGAQNKSPFGVKRQRLSRISFVIRIWITH